jgi:uncharacterized C2H2 Zn-finger protein
MTSFTTMCCGIFFTSRADYMKHYRTAHAR